MLKLKNYIVQSDIPFKMYLISDARVKRIHKEFEFYNVRFFREERVPELTVCLSYPEANPYWYLDFKKYVESEIIDKDGRYEREWNTLLATLKKEVSKDFEDFKRSLESITSNQVLDTMFKYNLRDYQAFDALQMILKMKYTKIPAGLILSEQRTGKTRVALTVSHMIMPKGSTVLIVCPKVAVNSWQTEIENMRNPEEDIVFKVKCIRQLKGLKNLEALDENAINFRIVTYGLFKTFTNPQIRTLIDSHNTKEVMLIGDEAHVLRNFKTLQSDAIFNFKELCLRDKLPLNLIGVTGTPAVKDSYDVFGCLSFINTSKIAFQPYIKDFNQFKEYFYNCEDTSYGKICRSLKRTNELNFIIQQSSVQTKQKNLELFKNYKKEYRKFEINMDSKQREIYEAVRDEMEYEDDIDCKNKLIQLTRLQQICTNPSALTASYDRLAPKLKWTVEFVQRHASQGIIMAKHLNVLETLAEEFDKNRITYSVMNGTCSYTKRKDEIAKFKNGNSKIFLIQQDTGRESLTLPEAIYTLFLERDFAQGYNEQAEARMTPIDGTPCTKYVIDVITHDTVEANIYDTLVIRKENIDNINTLSEILRKKEV